MRFEYSYLIYFLWITPLIILFFRYAFKHRKALLEKFCNTSIYSKIIEGYSETRRIIKYSILTVVFVLFIITLARPQLGCVWEDVHRRGVDIFVVLDVSDSMLAEDIDPSRLERAKRELIDFMNILEGDRIGLIVFAGSSFIQCPLTLDYNAIQMFVDTISTNSVPAKGTSIGSAIKIALDAFNRSAESSSKAIILITDGEDHMGQVIEMAKEAKKQNVIIYAIGIGSGQGGYIPDTLGFRKDLTGKVILTKPNFDQLKEIARITGGVYTNSVTGNLDIDNIYFRGIKKSLQAKNLKSSRQKIWIDRFQWPLSLALLLILTEYFFRERKKVNTPKKLDKVQQK